MSQFILRQIKQIQKEGLPVLKRKLGTLSLVAAKPFLIMVNGFWAVPAVLLMRALRPWVLVRIGTLWSVRIGHFVVDAAEQKARLIDQPPNTVDWFWLPKRTSNRQWELMVRRELPVYDWTRYLTFWNRLLPGRGKAHYRPETDTFSLDITGLFQKHDIKFSFMEKEETEALEWLTARGWQKGEPFVCVLVRDAAFLPNDPLNGGIGDEISYKSWSYHDYRNSDITTYKPALEWIANQGVWVLRMGRIMAKRLELNHPRVIDYAFCDDKSDLLDIWLFANCTFCITTATGVDGVCKVYKRPICHLNASPLGMIDSNIHCSHVPKHLYWAQSGKLVRLHDNFEHSYVDSEEYRRVGLELRDLSHEEILTYTQEFWQRLQGTWQDTESDLQLHRRFWQTLEGWKDFSKFHGWRHPESRVATTWLRQQPEDFFE